MTLRLRELREQLGQSQAQVAAGAGCTRAAISHWECGRQWPALAMLPRLAHALGVPVKLLIDFDGGPPPASGPQP